MACQLVWQRNVSEMRIIHVVGYSRVGKTQLIELLCQRLASRVLVLKFSHHPGLDRSGSDTDRFHARHADTLLIQPGQTTWRSTEPLAIDWPRMAPYYDWMIWEGGKHLNTPKIVFDTEDLIRSVSHVQLIIGPAPHQESPSAWYETPLPLTPDTTDAVADYIIRHQQRFSVDWSHPSVQEVLRSSPGHLAPSP